MYELSDAQFKDFLKIILQLDRRPIYYYLTTNEDEWWELKHITDNSVKLKIGQTEGPISCDSLSYCRENVIDSGNRNSDSIVRSGWPDTVIFPAEKPRTEMFSIFPLCS